MDRLGFHITVVLWIMVIVTFVIGVANKCSAQDERTVLALSQCLAAECDRCDRGEEKAAIAWVLKKRMIQYNANHKRQRTYYEQIYAYCAVFDRRSAFYHSERARLIRSGTLDYQPHLRRSEWENITEFSRGYLHGDITDPTPLGMHFGGRLDIQNAKRNLMKLITKYCNKKGMPRCTYIWGL